MGSATRRVHKWIWILIYLGMVLLALGLSVQRSDAALGWSITASGATAIVVGIVLIWIRSRIKNSNE